MKFVMFQGGSNSNNYANIELIVQIAKQFCVDAVWAGWGHASENPKLPHALEEINISFIGPPSKQMDILGDKISATIVAQSIEIPTIKWNGSNLKVNLEKDDCVPSEIYEKANIETVEEVLDYVNKTTLPVIIKASEGGGGKGIRIVNKITDAETAFLQVKYEVPNSPIFIMNVLSDCRHIEVQLLADKYNQVIALNGRDCSVQRRHQKILEEGPPIIVKPEIFSQMEIAAIRLAKSVGYVNAGTVEYLYDSKGNFFFLELNPRLQVEHPVTEMINKYKFTCMPVTNSYGYTSSLYPKYSSIFPNY